MPSAENLLETARQLRRKGDLLEAYDCLRQAVATGPDSYEFLAKAAELFERLKAQAPLPGTIRSCRVAYLCNHTVVFHLPILSLLAWLDGLAMQAYTPPYGTVAQVVMQPDSPLYAFAPDFVLFADHWRDANLPAISSEPESTTRAILNGVQGQWDTVLSRIPCRIIQHNFDLPVCDSYGALSQRLPGVKSAILHELNRQLSQIAPPQVAILDQDQISANFGRERWQDDRTWYLAKQHPAHAALPALAKAQLALIRAGLGLTKKVLVLDLDNTLWNGVIGEDGLGGIRLGPPDARGEAHQALQQYCRELKERGILLAVCSKNDEADARLPFEQHEGSILKLADFAVFTANWQDKASNLQAMAQKLNLGLDSFVFLDDNPAERAQVRAHLPMVTVPELANDPAEYIRTLAAGRYFEAWSLSDEDRLRADSYAKDAQREQLQRSAVSVTEYLRELCMVCTHGPFDEVTLPRVAQLVGKTNQFNLTSKRHSLEELRRFSQDEKHWTHWFRLQDKLGDSGIVGVIVAVDDGDAKWRIDTLLMSCRVMGRGMEQFMIQTLVAEARVRAIDKLVGVYCPTPKNSIVAEFYDTIGFRRLGGNDSAKEFELVMREAQLAASPIEDATLALGRKS
jgi:FkbH-like protein